MSVIQPGFCADSKRLPPNRYLLKIPFVDLHPHYLTIKTATQAGGRVVFVDTDVDTFTLDPDLIESKITPRTVGIIPVHLYGQAADMNSIMAIAQKRNLWVIEDCAQAHLARIQGKLVGTFGNAATFSFYPGKNLGAYGDAGCVVTNDDRLADWMATYARHGGNAEHIMEGINSRLDGLQAAVLKVKLPHLLALTQARRRVAAQYDEMLAEIGEVMTPEGAAILSGLCVPPTRTRRISGGLR